MKATYVETSALLAWLFGESASGDVLRELNAAEAIVTSSLTVLEAERAIHRAVSARLVKESAAHKLRGLLAREHASWITMSLTTDVLARAGRSFPVEPVRTLDAIHLATALAFTEALPDLRILTLDQRVAKNAKALGMVLS